jgi:hypothetical protein
MQYETSTLQYRLQNTGQADVIKNLPRCVAEHSMLPLTVQLFCVGRKRTSCFTFVADSFAAITSAPRLLMQTLPALSPLPAVRKNTSMHRDTITGITQAAVPCQCM